MVDESAHSPRQVRAPSPAGLNKSPGTSKAGARGASGPAPEHNVTIEGTGRPTVACPRICSLPRVPVDPVGEWSGWLSHVAAMGFSHVLLPASRAADGGAGDAARDGRQVVSPAAMVALCAQSRLGLLLDIDIRQIATDAPLRQEHPDWFQGVVDTDVVPDPRRPPDERGARWRLHDPAVAEAAGQWWSEQLTALARSGVAGFRLLAVDAASPAWWATLLDEVRDRAPGTLFLAWTQGLSPDLLAPLDRAQFDYTFCSFDWWDFRAPWLAEELQRLAAVAPPLACAAAPKATCATVDSPEPRDRDALEHAHRRAAWFAAGCAAGWLMPAGFEFATAASDPPALPTAPAETAPIDLSAEITRINAWLVARSEALRCPPVFHVGHGWAALLWMAGNAAQLLLANAGLDRDVATDIAAIGAGAATDFGPWRDLQQDVAADLRALGAGEVRLLQATRTAPVKPRDSATLQRQHLGEATRAPRIAIENIVPSVDSGRFAVKRVVGDRVRVEADVFMDGHDVLAVSLRWRALDEKRWHEQRMRPLGNDRYVGEFTPARIGPHEYTVQAWRDAYASYHHEITVKHDAGLDIALELEEGRLLVERTAAQAPPGHRRHLRALAVALTADRDDDTRYRHLVADATRTTMEEADLRPFAFEHPPLRLEVDRRAAQFASWYELFPRSQTDSPTRHGTFRDVIGRLPAIQAMGFDVLYFPPIHPIGAAFRKGRNNTLTPAPDDPGSPYAIGSPEGGHDALHPELGTIEDFRAMRDAAHAHGLELALDFAIQCSPDHPWLREHPDWFDWRPDGSLRYAENPPKKYQDIVNVDFYTEGAIPSLWQALCDVVLYWAGEGVRTFRVDNPHTKPYPFWEWMIARVRATYPDALFLAEAFTRPKPMYRLAKAGFNQSYTYFTWRHGKQEFIDYLTELSQGAPKDFFRPHFFVNTPDINPYFLQHSGRTGFLIRAALATTLSGLWGMYSGFELCEGTPIPGKEEYLHSEKYEIKPRDWNLPGNIVAEITRLNTLRRRHPALQSHLGVRFLPASNDHVLFFEKFFPAADLTHADDRVLVAISLDPHADQTSDLTLPLEEWGLSADGSFEVDDLLHDVTSTWHGAYHQVWLGQGLPYAIWHIRVSS
jgi:starch synthase (maltosyl-transferring)